MALPSDQLYFPPLEDCLKGDEILLSWKLVASALSDASCDLLTSQALSAFLTDPQVHTLLKSPGRAFEAPSAQSKALFETKTAAINVTPTPNGKYDIKTIKEDAIWVSKCLNLDEVIALRLVVVELQARARTHLSTTPLSSQDVVNIQDATGASSTSTVNGLAGIDPANLVDAEAIWSEFETQDCRRKRLLATYLSERRYFMMFADYATSFMLQWDPSYGAGKPAADALRRDMLEVAAGRPAGPELTAQTFELLLPSYLDELPGCIKRAGEGAMGAVQDTAALSQDLEVDWARTALTEAIHAMTLVFQVLWLTRDGFATPEVAGKWFKFMDSYQFLDTLSPENEMLAELILPLKSLVCANSLAILNPDRCIAYLEHRQDLADSDGGFLASPETLSLMHETISGAAESSLVAASPVIFSWALVLHRLIVSYQERIERRDLAQNQRAQVGFETENDAGPSSVARRGSAGSTVSLEASLYDGFLVERVGVDRDAQVVERLAMGVTAGGLMYDFISDVVTCAGAGRDSAFRAAIGPRIRLVVVDLLKASYPIIGYQSEPMTSLLAALSGGREPYSLTNDRHIAGDGLVASSALGDPLLLQFYVFEALNRYPYEFLPFTSLCRVLSTGAGSEKGSDIVLESLLRTPSLTLELPDGLNYELFDEDSNSSRFRILEDLPLFAPVSSRRRRLADEKAMHIPAGAEGRILSDPDTMPGRKTVIIAFDHSTLALLGKRLEVNLARESFNPTLGFLGPAETAEALSLLTSVVRAETSKSASTSRSSVPSEAALAILQEATKELSAKDIVTVVCDTLDTFMQADLSNSEDPILAVLAACMEFLHAVLPVCPGRVWAYMSRCQLLNTESRAGRLARLTATSDMASERFRFLASSVQFLSSLVDSVLASAVQRKAGSRLSSRQQDSDGSWLGTSDKILAQVSLAIAQTAIDVFENTSTWKFSSPLDCSVLVRDVVSIMDKLIRDAFTFGDATTPGGLAGSLKPAAVYVVGSFLSPTSAALRFQPLLATLLAGLEVSDSTLYPVRARLIIERTNRVVDFATSLLASAMALGKDSLAMEAQLFKSSLLLARLCAARGEFVAPSLNLLASLVVSAGRESSEPPSLLGYLGAHVSRSFLQILTNLDKPFKRPRDAAGIWTFFAVVVKHRQQWMANCLLTGKTPREALQSGNKTAELSRDSALAIAREKLRSISDLPGSEALAVLDFFTSAQNHWPWTNIAIWKESDYLRPLCSYVGKLESASTTAKSDPLGACQQARIAAYIAEVLSMQLYHLRQLGEEEATAKLVVDHLDYFLRDGVEIGGYNASLHANFQRNFANRYPGCSLDDLKRTSLSREDLGPKFYYAIDYAQTMLDFDSAWAGLREDGFRMEIQAANLNLSLVDAQIALFHAWELFLLELANCLLPKNPRIVAPILQVASQCLTANQNQQGPVDILARTTQARANLSLLLVQRLADCSMLPKDSSQLLVAVWTTVGGVEQPFAPEQIQYYRTLLKTLYVVLRGWQHSETPAEQNSTSVSATVAEISPTILNILDRVVAQGFRTLVTLIHDPEATVSTQDVALLTGILQACLSVPNMDQFQTQILNIMAAQDVLHVATSLFSWSGKLADKGDPIYGELSLLFLLELSALPAVAEQLACDGLLGHLTSANLAAHMRRPNVSPFADTAGAQRCYSIWSKAMLPLLLNLLIALGSTVAPEVASVLRQFPHLLETSVTRFDVPGLSRTAAPAARESAQQHLVTLLAVSEIHSLALLTRVLAALRAAHNRDIPDVAWDAAPLLENVEVWLSRPKLLRDRLVPLGQREVEWRAMGPLAKGGGVDNRLQEKVVGLLEAVKAVLSEAAE